VLLAPLYMRLLVTPEPLADDLPERIADLVPRGVHAG
jgi:hypothetical protein